VQSRCDAPTRKNVNLCRKRLIPHLNMQSAVHITDSVARRKFRISWEFWGGRHQSEMGNVYLRPSHYDGQWLVWSTVLLFEQTYSIRWPSNTVFVQSVPSYYAWILITQLFLTVSGLLILSEGNFLFLAKKRNGSTSKKIHRSSRGILW